MTGKDWTILALILMLLWQRNRCKKKAVNRRRTQPAQPLTWMERIIPALSLSPDPETKPGSPPPAADLPDIIAEQPPPEPPRFVQPDPPPPAITPPPTLPEVIAPRFDNREPPPDFFFFDLEPQVAPPVVNLPEIIAQEPPVVDATQKLFPNEPPVNLPEIIAQPPAPPVVIQPDPDPKDATTWPKTFEALSPPPVTTHREAILAAIQPETEPANPATPPTLLEQVVTVIKKSLFAMGTDPVNKPTLPGFFRPASPEPPLSDAPALSLFETDRAGRAAPPAAPALSLFETGRAGRAAPPAAPALSRFRRESIAAPPASPMQVRFENDEPVVIHPVFLSPDPLPPLKLPPSTDLIALLTPPDVFPGPEAAQPPVNLPITLPAPDVPAWHATSPSVYPRTFAALSGYET